MNPAVPLINSLRERVEELDPKANTPWYSPVLSALFNIAVLAIVCFGGFLGWWISTAARRSPYRRHDDGRGGPPSHEDNESRHGDPSYYLPFDAFGQIFGYLCAIFYLGSRVPQLMLNHRRKSTEGVSMLFSCLPALAI